MIVWDDSFAGSTVDYEVVDIEHTPDADRAMHRVTKCLHSKRDGRFIQIVVLQDVVAEIVSENSGSTTV